MVHCKYPLLYTVIQPRLKNADLQAFVTIPFNEFRKQPKAWNRNGDHS